MGVQPAFQAQPLSYTREGGILPEENLGTSSFYQSVTIVPASSAESASFQRERDVRGPESR